MGGGRETDRWTDRNKKTHRQWHREGDTDRQTKGEGERG